MRKSIATIFTLIVIAVLVFTFARTRRSTSSSSIHATTPTTVTNLGVVWLSEQTSQHFDIGPRDGWNVTAKPFTNGTIRVVIVPDEANTNGMPQPDKSRGTVTAIMVTTPPGRLVSFQLDSVVVRFTPNLKPE